jgi:hypothetical protein
MEAATPRTTGAGIDLTVEVRGLEQGVPARFRVLPGNHRCARQHQGAARDVRGTLRGVHAAGLQNL